jgi:hypothetical protein
MGYPVALLASALERLALGFTSITANLSAAGERAY